MLPGPLRNVKEQCCYILLVRILCSLLYVQILY